LLCIWTQTIHLFYLMY